jgi:hypothetical protein
MTDKRLGWIQTWSGKRVFLDRPDRDVVEIEDIAHALANVCRFGGHSHFYSVAQHSILVSELVREKDKSLALAGLLHDAAEAYLGDVVRPLKRILGASYSDLERAWMTVIAEKFSAPGVFDPLVKEADNQALAIERRDVMTQHPEIVKEWEDLPPPPALALFPRLHFMTQLADVPSRLLPFPPHPTRLFFLRQFEDLTRHARSGSEEAGS